MTKNEILQSCTNYLIADTALAGDLHTTYKTNIIKPALVGVNNDGVTFKSSEEDDGLYVNFYSSDGLNCANILSRYREGEYIYIREPYTKDNGYVEYHADIIGKLRQGCLKIRKLTSGRFMKKEDARTFFKITKVSVMRLYDTKANELHAFGYRSFKKFFEIYDVSLSEREYEFCRSEFNPYVFVYEIERVFSDEIKSLGNSKITLKERLENGEIISGTVDEIVLRKKKANEEYIMKTAEKAPAFARLLSLVKERKTIKL